MDDRMRAIAGAVQLWRAGDQDRFWLYMRKLCEYDPVWWNDALLAVTKFTNKKHGAIAREK